MVLGLVQATFGGQGQGSPAQLLERLQRRPALLVDRQFEVRVGGQFHGTVGLAVLVAEVFGGRSTAMRGLAVRQMVDLAGIPHVRATATGAARQQGSCRQQGGQSRHQPARR